VATKPIPTRITLSCRTFHGPIQGLLTRGPSIDSWAKRFKEFPSDREADGDVLPVKTLCNNSIRLAESSGAGRHQTVIAGSALPTCASPETRLRRAHTVLSARAARTMSSPTWNSCVPDSTG
jgi:hypothetical protein